MAQEFDQEFLEYVVKGLVDNPDAVKVDRKVDEMGVLLTLDVAQEDMGKIIGRQGNTAKAIRTLLRVVGMKNNARVNLKVNEPEGGLRAGGASSSAPSTASSESAPDTGVPADYQSADVDDAMNELKA